MEFPSLLADLATKRFTDLKQVSPEYLAEWQGKKQALLMQSLSQSDFIYRAINQDTGLLSWLHSHADFSSRAENYRDYLKTALCEAQNEASFHAVLRRFRRQEMLWLAWQDINNQMELEASLKHLSALAEAITLEAYHWLYQISTLEWGTPCNDQGIAQPMLILGMGKLGGQELNFSSDIDLIFTYPENGETQGKARSISNAEFFTRLGRRLIKALDQQTVDGFCYRVDMRLRPFGDSGPLVMSFAALEDYYQEQGRDWERYAMVKAKVLGEEHEQYQEQLRSMLRPFVFRRYIDFSAIQSLRSMKNAIQTEIRRRGLHNNIKLGAGGIRDIEFICQSFQLIRGGREPLLRQANLLFTLEVIQSLRLLNAEDVALLQKAYPYLRRVENLLQAIDDKQTQTLPNDELDQARLAFAMQEESWDKLKGKLDELMQKVNQIFNNLIGCDDEDKELEPKYSALWELNEKRELEALLAEYGVAEPEQAASALVYFKQEVAKRTIGPRGRNVLDHLMPILLFKAINFDKELHFLEPVFGVLNRILTRTTYLELLDQNHGAIDQLIRLCAASPMLAEQLKAFPMLLDELLDPQSLYQSVVITDYKPILFEYLARIPKEDMEQQMEQIRQFKQTQLLRTAAADIFGTLPVMRVSDQLTFLAEAIVDAVVNQAWEQMSQKYGIPTHLEQMQGNERGFAVIAYGKLGGIELGYDSDLDLVFVHDCPEGMLTNGNNPIDGWQFYSRLAQRIMHLFSTRTNSGVLYEIDTRLRPSGGSGMLVTTLNAFEQYQHKEAWIWEHQALVRARVIYGNKEFKRSIQEVRQAVLCKERDIAELKNDVANMREKMRLHLLEPRKSNQTLFHLKQGKGGIVDIEFITQYLVLAHAHLVPKLAYWSDNIRILDEIAKANILSLEQITALQQAYIEFRSEAHRLTLRGKPIFVDKMFFSQEKELVARIWQQI